MQLLEQYMIGERPLIMEQNIRVSVIGRREGICRERPAGNGRDRRHERREHGHAALPGHQLRQPGGTGRRLPPHGREVHCGRLQPEAIDEETIAAHLYTAGMPEPDLLIRTAQEMRVSNFLLWQISYAEIWVTELCWPDFDEALLHAAIREFASRDRRFGGLGE